MPHVIIEHGLGHDFTPPFFFAPPQNFVGLSDRESGVRLPHHSHFTSRPIRLTPPSGGALKTIIQGAYVTPRALFELKMLAKAGQVRLHANPLLRPSPRNGPTDGRKVATLQELGSALELGRFKAEATTSTTTHVALVDDGVSEVVLKQRLADKGVSKPKFAVAELCEIPELPAPFAGTKPSHGGMCAFDVCVFGSDIELLDFPLNQAQSGTRIVEAVGVLEHLMSLLGAGKIGPRLVVVNCWQTQRDDPEEGTKTDDINHIFNQRLLALEAVGADIVFSAPSHNLNEAKTIHGPAGNPGVTCVTAVDIDKQRFRTAGRGPGTMGGQKPDLSAFTFFKGYELRGEPDDGTSAAAAVVGGVVAGIRSQGYAGTPQELRNVLRENAAELGQAGYDELFGFGLVDPNKALAASNA